MRPALEASGVIDGRKLEIRVWSDRLELRDKTLLPKWAASWKSKSAKTRTIPFREIEGAAVNEGEERTALRLGTLTEWMDIEMEHNDVVTVAKIIHTYQAGGRQVPPSPYGGPQSHRH